VGGKSKKQKDTDVLNRGIDGDDGKDDLEKMAKQIPDKKKEE
jgi:hypothetical protein